MSDIASRAQELLTGRLDAVQKLNERQEHAVHAREAADTAEREAASAWTQATQAGWSSMELKRLGLTQPTNRRGGRPKGSRTSKTHARAAVTEHHEPNQTDTAAEDAN